MTNEELDAIEARANAATAGPWGWQDFGGGCYLTGQYGPRPIILSVIDEGSKHVIANLEPDHLLAPLVPEHPDSVFIENARDDVPALVAEIRRLREEDGRARGGIAAELDAESKGPTS